jgi:hypothetical protein
MGVTIGKVGDVKLRAPFLKQEVEGITVLVMNMFVTFASPLTSRSVGVLCGG